MDRRSFIIAMPAIGFLGSKPGGLSVSGQGLVSGRSLVVEELGVQLYTLRALLSKDVDGTLAQVAEIGYQTVEFAGLYGLTPGEMRTTMDAVGLRAVSSHAGVNDIRGDWASFLEGVQELGQDFVFVPSIPESERTPEGLREWPRTLTGPVKWLARLGSISATITMPGSLLRYRTAQS